MKHVVTILIAGLSILTSISATSQEIIAHRGASYLAPENTVAAVELGYELGADAVEIDVHLSLDKHIMVNHDRTTARTANGTNYNITETKAELLRTLDVGSWKDVKFKGERIPYLQEIFEVVPEGKSLVIEVKSGSEILPYLKKKIEESGIEHRLVLISFNKDVVIQWKQMKPEMPVFWLLYAFNKYSQEEAIEIAKENGIDGLNVHYGLINPEFVKLMREENLKVLAYTVNDGEVAKKLQKMKIDAITTDRPGQIRKVLQ